MVSYKELGLVNTREMFAKAIKGGYAIPAFNFNNMEQMQAIVQACVETSSPVIMQVSSGARKYANPTILRYMAQGAVEYAKELGKNIPIVLHLDHGDTFELCKDCVDMGFSSVMIDGSHLPYDENVALTKKVVEYAHKHDVTVEGELGVLAGVEDEVSAEHHTYTRPEDVEDFVKKTGVDSLAISIGTSHGANKFKPEQCTRNADGVLVPPELRFDILEEIEKRIPGFPIVLHGSSSVPQYANPTILRYMAQGAVEYAKELGKNIPIVLHLDHGDTFELCKDCVDMGFSSVMIDGSHLPYDENVALTKKVVEYAHKHDVTVEGELGVLAGVEDEVSAEHHTYTRPEDVEDFVKKTGVDSLAISIGTSHGANKFKPEQCTRNADGVLVPPELRFDILEEIEKRIPGFPIVLHGSSSVPQEYVHIINTHGGALKDAIGIPEEQLRRAAKSAVCKINIDSDSRLAMTAAVRLVLTDKPAEFDPRKYLGPAREEMKKLYMHKCEKVLGSAGKA